MDVTMENISFEGMVRLLHELTRPYPQLQREAFFLNSHELSNILHGLSKRYKYLQEKTT
jgi:hypothetical protein